MLYHCKMKLLLVLALVLGFSNCRTQIETLQVTEVDRIHGITMVAPPEEFVNDPMKPILKVNADWICLVPYAFCRQQNPTLRFNLDQQWWGEKQVGIEKSIQLAHDSQLSVMIKPQIYVPGGWIGRLEYSDEDWILWEKGYREYILSYAQLAQKHNVAMLCIGTEIKVSVKKRVEFWKQLIHDIRDIYDGEIVYSANWDSYDDFPLWEELDYIGISAYFPLSDVQTPKIATLKDQWKKISKALSSFSKRHKKPILFTEFGYQSVDGCAGKAWEIEKDIYNRSINDQAQANAYAALLQFWKNEKYWAGGFLWKWFPNMRGHEGYPERDYTPQGKLAEEYITQEYLKKLHHENTEDQ